MPSKEKVEPAEVVLFAMVAQYYPDGVQHVGRIAAQDSGPDRNREKTLAEKYVGDQWPGNNIKRNLGVRKSAVMMRVDVPVNYHVAEEMESKSGDKDKEWIIKINTERQTDEGVGE